MKIAQALRWTGDALEILDQTQLPHREARVAVSDVERLAVAIERLEVRGAPAIGVAAAFGVVLGALGSRTGGYGGFVADVEAAIERLERTRPTAVNLFWALGRMRETLASVAGPDREAATARLLAEACCIQEEDRRTCQDIGDHGAALIPDGTSVLTHCNAGALATAGWGTALGIVYAAVKAGKRVSVLADETRPLMQGARLTAWELGRAGVEVKLLCDGAAPFAMQRRLVDVVIVGADRIAANGDVANKIGTYGVALAAARHGIPFYVASPVSTIDVATPAGADIPIETRSASEVMTFGGAAVAPESVDALNLAFDVTPSDLVSAIITERGVARPPYEPTLRAWTKREKRLDSFGSDGLPS